MRAAWVLVLATVAAAGCGETRRAAEQQPAAAGKPGKRALAVVPGTRAAAAGEPGKPSEPAEQAEPAQTEPRSCAGEAHGLGGTRVAYAAVAERETVAYRTPAGEQIATFGVLNQNRHATVFGVRRVVLGADCRIAWYRVRLPIRPNGVEGYVHADDVRLVRVHTRIVIDLSDRELVLYRDGEPFLRTRAAVGAPETPTPTGRYYVNQRLIAADPAGPWGPGALGISAFSDVLQDWAQGGPIAIHGTNQPWSIGQPASHGCVRLQNDVLERVFRMADAGTPVIIRA